MTSWARGSPKPEVDALRKGVKLHY